MTRSAASIELGLHGAGQRGTMHSMLAPDGTSRGVYHPPKGCRHRPVTVTSTGVLPPTKQFRVPLDGVVTFTLKTTKDSATMARRTRKTDDDIDELADLADLEDIEEPEDEDDEVEEEPTETAAQKKKRLAAEKRAAAKKAKEEAEAEDDDEDDEDDDSDEDEDDDEEPTETAAQKKKRLAKEKAAKDKKSKGKQTPPSNPVPEGAVGSAEMAEHLGVTPLKLRTFLRANVEDFPKPDGSSRYYWKSLSSVNAKKLIKAFKAAQKD